MNSTNRASIQIKTGLLMLLLCNALPQVKAERMDSYKIGRFGQANIHYPAWFKESFLDLREDLLDAQQAGKKGLILFFSQKSCNHCQAFIHTTLEDASIKKRVMRSFDVISMDIFSDVEVTDIDGSRYPVRDFAETKRARLTPTLLIYGVEKKQLAKIIGFYPPEKFSRVLDYIESEQYNQTSLAQYLRNTLTSMNTTASSTQSKFEPDNTLFSKPPYQLKRPSKKHNRPLLVVFDRPDCNPCSRFHKRVLAHEEIRTLMKQFDAVQLNSLDRKTMLELPDGRTRSAYDWAAELQLAYDISVVFFDAQGQEVHRLDAESGKDRMAGSMSYVLEKAYQRHQQYMRWRKENAQKRAAQKKP